MERNGIADLDRCGQRGLMFKFVWWREVHEVVCGLHVGALVGESTRDVPSVPAVAPRNEAQCDGIGIGSSGIQMLTLSMPSMP